MRLVNKKVSVKPLILPFVFILSFVNPYVETLMFSIPAPYMLDHYALYTAGAIIGYKFFRTSFYEFILGIIPAVLWHIPLFFALGASFILYRALCELTLFLGGLLVGGHIPQLKLSYKVLWLGIYMLGDSILSIFFVLSYPQYSDEGFSFLHYSPQELPITGVIMFIVMNVILVYAIVNIMRSAAIF